MIFLLYILFFIGVVSPFLLKSPPDARQIEREREKERYTQRKIESEQARARARDVRLDAFRRERVRRE